MKRSQMEIMGLAIIVIIIGLGLLFVIKFQIDFSNPDTRIKSTQSLLAGSFINTLVETSARECSNMQFKTLYIDCTNNPPDGRIYCEGFGDYSCNYIWSATANLLELTFDKQNKDYYFFTATDINKPDETKVMEPIGKKCEKGHKSADQPLPSFPQVHLVLQLCS
jgi:hypothetical protein